MDREILWADNVNEAQSLVKNKDKYQMKIAELAIEVCVIERGGNKDDNIFSVINFAKDISINVKTLYNWIDIYKSTYSVLDEKTKSQISATGIQNIHRAYKGSSPEKIRSEAKKYVHQNNIDATIRNYLGTVRSLTRNYIEKDAANRVDKEVNETLYHYVKLLNDILSENKVKPKESIGVIVAKKGFSKKGLPLVGYYTDEDGFKIKITEKDVSVLRYLKTSTSRSKGLTPTKIGQSVGKKNSNNASAWSLRSLEKLVALNWVDRKDGGIYKAR